MNAISSRRAVALACMFALFVAACGSSSKTGAGGSTSGSSVTLNGSGSTFQKAFDEAAIQGFQGTKSNITINYAGGGSGKGKTDLQTKTVDFAGTDSTIKPEDISKYQGGTVLYFPTVVAPITVSYNVSGLDKLQLSADTLAKIFSDTVKKWDDASIASDNPGARLPSGDITVAHRADASGTTSNFSKYLAKAGGASWTLGTPGDTVSWPGDMRAGQGNAGVAQIIKQTEGAIGYVDYSDAVASGLKFASIKNESGSYVAPTLDAASAAAAAAAVADDLTYSPLDESGADVYPITSPTWIMVYAKQTDPNKGHAIKDFLTYVLNDGQSLAKDAKYAPLPDSLKAKAVAQLAKIEIPA